MESTQLSLPKNDLEKEMKRLGKKLHKRMRKASKTRVKLYKLQEKLADEKQKQRMAPNKDMSLQYEVSPHQ